MAFEIYLVSLMETSSGFVSGQRFVIWYFPQMITRQRQINDHQRITMLLSTFDMCSLRRLLTGDLAVPPLRVHPIPDAQISHHPILQHLDLADTSAMGKFKEGVGLRLSKNDIPTAWFLKVAVPSPSPSFLQS